MKRIFQSLFLIFIIFAFATCKKIKTNPPEASTLDTLIQPPLSLLYVPVQYRVSDFQKIINEKIQGKFIDKWMNLNDKGDSLYLAISRMREITIQRKDRTLFIVVPLKISGKVKAKVAGIKIKNEAPVEAEINIHLSTTLKMDPKWNLLSDTHLDKIDWIKEPKLKVGFVNVNLRGPIEKMLDKKEESVTAKADGILKTALNTRKVVSDIWRDIQLAHRINKQGVQVWLRPYGVDLKGRLEETEPDLISLQFELKTYTHIYFEGDSIPPPNTVLPDFKRTEKTNDSLIVYVHSLLRFDMINGFLEKELAGKPISAKGFTTTIQHVKVYGTKTGIAVALQVRGDIDGTLYVKGTPAYDSLTNTIALKDFEFDISSESALLNSADWLFHSKVLELISDKLKVNLTPLAVQLPKIIFNAIEKGKTGEKIDLNVDTLTIHPQIILPTKDNLQLLVLATGKASVTLNEKLFNKNDKRVSVR